VSTPRRCGPMRPARSTRWRGTTTDRARARRDPKPWSRDQRRRGGRRLGFALAATCGWPPRCLIRHRVRGDRTDRRLRTLRQPGALPGCARTSELMLLGEPFTAQLAKEWAWCARWSRPTRCSVPRSSWPPLAAARPPPTPRSSRRSRTARWHRWTRCCGRGAAQPGSGSPGSPGAWKRSWRSVGRVSRRMSAQPDSGARPPARAPVGPGRRRARRRVYDAASLLAVA